MSEVVTLTGGASARIYGTYAEAQSYLGSLFGEQYTAWLALTPDDQKRTLIGATRLLDRLTYTNDYAAFVDRDAEVWDDGITFPFRFASYELAAAATDDPSVLGAPGSSPSIQRVYAGGAGVDFASPVDADDTTSGLPGLIDQLLADYLLGSTPDSELDGGIGVSGSCENPFASPRDFDRTGPY